MKHLPSTCVIFLCTSSSFYCVAEPAHTFDLEHIEVTGHAHEHHPSGAAETLLNDYGVDFSAAGGISALPVLNGLMGDRVAVSIDGNSITAACANQMNPPLSYVSASQISRAQVLPGVSPVSMGGDNIAGIIAIDTLSPQYSDNGRLAWQSGYVGANHRTNGQLNNLNGGMSVASETMSLSYAGAFEDADSYEDGDGNTVYDTLYRAQNHQLNAAMKKEGQQLAVKLSHQIIPFQGFANQYMDMTDNRSTGFTVRFDQTLTNGHVQIQANWHDVEHEMGFFSEEKVGMMPMLTDASDRALTARWETASSTRHRLRLGAEYHHYQLDDWWPAVEGSMMMGPDDYININNGIRSRTGVYVESDYELSRLWQFSAGLRLEHVITDSDPVAPYTRMSMMGMPNPDAEAADRFNAAERRQTDTLADISFLLTYSPTDNHLWEAGLARKNRAPNLYERYSWGVGRMASTMIGWFGDGNGYTGDIMLRPETAHTATISYSFSNDAGTTALSFAPFYTRVNDFIDVSVVGTFAAFNRTEEPGAQRHALRFTNLDATLYGIRATARQHLLANQQAGRLVAELSATLNRGSRDDGGEPLYQQMPWQLALALDHSLDAWQSKLEVTWTDAKQRVDPRRRENTTDSYTLVNVSTQYQWQDVRVKVGISNLLDTDYALPLGGVSVADIRMGRSQQFEQIHGVGRSFNVGIRYEF